MWMVKNDLILALLLLLKKNLIYIKQLTLASPYSFEFLANKRQDHKQSRDN